jgi:ectoine hydroxylase-related dioxygenase (phytanoyl-CoA dioxygenase family)
MVVHSFGAARRDEAQIELTHESCTVKEIPMQDSMRKAFRDDGAVLIKGVLSKEDMARCRAAFDWAVENHGPQAFRIFDGTEQQSHNDNANPLARDRLEELVASLPLGQLLADLWGSQHVWYFAEEVFLKAGGRGSRTPWHQDTSYLPWDGEHLGNAWISFEAVPKQNALEIIRGSHRGTLLRRNHLPRSERSD